MKIVMKAKNVKTYTTESLGAIYYIALNGIEWAKKCPIKTIKKELIKRGVIFND